MPALFDLLLTSLILLFLIPTATGYELSIHNAQNASLRDIQGEHIIQENGNLVSKLSASVNVDWHFPREHSNLTVYFSPFEQHHSPPISALQIRLCGEFSRDSSMEQVDSDCKQYEYILVNYSLERYQVANGTGTLRNYTTYAISFIPADAETWQSYDLQINYTTDDFVFTQGDYDVAVISVQNADETVRNLITLPTAEDIPRFIPNAENIGRELYIDKTGEIKYRWFFYFVGSEENVIWYTNDKKIKDQQIALQDKYTWKGILIGFFVAVLLLMIEKIFDHSVYKKKLLEWLREKYPAYFKQPRTKKK